MRPSKMADEMHEEPRVLRALVARRAALRRELLRVLPNDLRGVALSDPRATGAVTVTLTADTHSPFADAANLWIDLGPGLELAIPTTKPESLVTIPAAVRGQQLTLALSAAKDLDPDKPPSLSKVTLT